MRARAYGRRGSAAALVLALGAFASGAAAQPSPPSTAPVQAVSPDVVEGLERPGVEPGDQGRDVAAALLFLPRNGVALLFRATGAVASVIRDEQIVPRISELLAPSPGALSVSPTLVLRTDTRPLVGAQMIGTGGDAATRVTVGFGGIYDLLGEGRVHYTLRRPIPLVLRLETLADSRSSLPYLGVGQAPDLDPRNRFQRDAVSHQADYWERRSRLIATAGVRPGDDLELMLSMTLVQSRVSDPPEQDPQAIGKVFVPGSVTGAPGLSRILYGEAAVRVDTRRAAARPTGGALVEGYAGAARGVAGDPARFVRLGGRVGVFLPILRPSNVLSARIVLDAMARLEEAPVPFTELVGQPDYRGEDTRRDNTSYVASFDYRWGFLENLGARLFLDLAAVGPDVRDLLEAHPRAAVGFGLDLYTESTTIGEVSIAGSADGLGLSLSFGAPSRFGDRLHRY